MNILIFYLGTFYILVGTIYLTIPLIYLELGRQKDLIKAYMSELDHPYDISFIEEKIKSEWKYGNGSEEEEIPDEVHDLEFNE